MAQPSIRFLFDYVSPYAFLAWTQVHAIAERAGATVEPVPVLFAAMLNHFGQLGPAEIPAKRAYVMKDIARRAHRFGVVMKAPPAHPFNPLAALRATVAVSPDQRRAAIDALFASTWQGAEPHGVESADKVVRILATAGIDLPPESLSDPAVKQGVRENTEQAIESGVFGVPTMMVGDELFWGTDSLEFLESYLRGSDPADPQLVAQLLDLPVGSRR